jgi:two-component system nitrogen regulation sensor histidine kinase GlnL
MSRPTIQGLASPTDASAAAPTIQLDSLATAVVLLDASGHLLALNLAAETLLEVSAARAVGSPLLDYIDSGQEWPTLLQQTTMENLPMVRRGLELRLHSGSVQTIDLILSPLYRSDGIQILLEMNPVDRLNAISEGENLWSSQKTLRTVIKGLAHEVKNPLGGIRGAAQLLALELQDPSLSEYTDIIVAESDRLRNLVDHMLGPREQLTRTATNIHEVLERVRQLVAVEADGSISFQRDYDPSLPEFLADAAQVTQALLNIVRNAWQAVGSEGTITLRTRARRQYTVGGRRHRLVVAVDVIDDGPGVPEALMGELFLPMVTGRADGTGLGLSIAQVIANRHGGLIQCHSEPGQTCFTLLLPMETPPYDSR